VKSLLQHFDALSRANLWVPAVFFGLIGPTPIAVGDERRSGEGRAGPPVERDHSSCKCAPERPTRRAAEPTLRPSEAELLAAPHPGAYQYRDRQTKLGTVSRAK
jgi:hypothetical protein